MRYFACCKHKIKTSMFVQRFKIKKWYMPILYFNPFK